MASTMRMQVRVVELAPGLLRYSQPPAFREDIAALLRGALAKTTGEPWQVERLAEGGAPTLVEMEEQRKHAAAEAVRSAPLVAATLAAFPQAELIEDDRQAASGGGGNWRR